MKFDYLGNSYELKDGDSLQVDGLELVGDGFDINKARSLGVGSWNEKYIRNFLYLLSLIRSQSVVDLSALYTKNEVDTLIDDRINFLIGSAPQNLDTLYEISMRLEEDSGAISQILNLLSQKADKSEIKDFPIGFVRLVPANIPSDSKYLDISGQTLQISAYPELASFLGSSYLKFDSVIPFSGTTTGLNSPANAFDSNTSSLAYANAGVSNIVIDYGSLKSVSKITFIVQGALVTGAAATLRVSSDNVNWTDLYTFSTLYNSTPYSYSVLVPSSLSAIRYVRFVPNAQQLQGQFSLYDFKMYDTAVSQFTLPAAITAPTGYKYQIRAK